MRMPQLHELPVEIWQQVLRNVFDVPYALDTTVPTDGCFWHQQDRYHDKQVYWISEQERKKLRLVCRSWRDYVDEYRCRWISWDPHPFAMNREAMEAGVALGIREDYMEDPVPPIRPFRAFMSIKNETDYSLFKSSLNDTFGRLTTLFVHCSSLYGPAIFDLLIANAHSLPDLRCLMLKHINFRETPLSLLSKAFPFLTGLTLDGGLLPPNPNDCLRLSQLESLYLDLPSLEGMSCKTWHLPGLVRLSVPLARREREASQVFECLRSHGANMTFLHISYGEPATLPRDIWRWCPHMTEIVTSFSIVTLEGPIPAEHPLRYLVHLALNDSFTDNSPTLLHNIELLPPNSTVVVGVRSWERYMKENVPTAVEDNAVRLWTQVDSLCRSKEIRLEDEEKETFDKYLTHRDTVKNTFVPRGLLDSLTLV
ncbi:hypothetical protein PIIN_06583 [Serendipita indica DSM 11827]|uniref:F-box domain-containing protein n=1 Tax=Serendipita indica (strain DSM 11827) TaxID=1109443 RepID=G4TMV6_SERID|nr:hypothetical protein PIIN_06583 [Serendipita indica DSM 11827]